MKAEEMKADFQRAETLEELKKVYRDWAMRCHPDRGGTDEGMKAVNHLYEIHFERVKNRHTNKDGETYTKETSETPNQFPGLINALLRLDGIHIEIIGCFVWVTGNTKPHKDTLKYLGMRWHSQKTAWYWHSEQWKGSKARTKTTLDEVRTMYGVQYDADGRGTDQKLVTA